MAQTPYFTLHHMHASHYSIVDMVYTHALAHSSDSEQLQLSNNCAHSSPPGVLKLLQQLH